MALRDFKKERGRRRQYARAAAGFVGLAALAFVSAGAARAAWGMYQKFAEASSADAGAQRELGAMQARYSSAKTSLDALQTDRGVEAALRERYGVAKPGESEIDVVRQATSTDATGESGTDGLLERLWQALFVW